MESGELRPPEPTDCVGCGADGEATGSLHDGEGKRVTVTSSKWESYEEVAVYLLDQVAGELGLERVEGKQGVFGSRSSVTWTIEGKGVKVGGDGFVIIECRRYTTSRQRQEQVGGLAYRIIDTGAAGGIVVSPLGLQEGAKKVAAAENIQEVFLSPDSTCTEYMLRFLNRIFVGVTDRVTVAVSVTAQVIRAGEAREPFHTAG
jgi:hypothetical protein